MAETDWLGLFGRAAGQVGGAYLGAYAGNPQWGAQVGGALGGSLGSATSQETGLTEGAGYDANSMFNSFGQGMSGGGGGMGGMGGGGAGMFAQQGGGMDMSPYMGALMGMFGGGGGEGGGGAPMYRAPMMSTEELFARTGALLPQMAQQSTDFNFARQPGYTRSQLNAEQDIAPGTFDLRSLAIQKEREALERGWRLPPDMELLLADRAAQTLGTSGAGSSNLGQMFSLRSLAGAGLDREEQNRATAFQRSQFQPSYYQPLDVYGHTPGMVAAGDFRGMEATQNNMANANMAIQAAAQQKQTADFNNYLARAGGMMQSGGGGGGMTANNTIGGPNQGIGGQGGFDWTKSFGRPSSVKAQGLGYDYPVGSDQYNAAFAQWEKA